jgi:hypothetical protein
LQLTIKPRSVMLYGVSGSTKTSQVYHMAKWILKNNPGKKIRMIASDGGGWAPFQDSGMVERGEVEIFDFSYREYALSDWRKLNQGYWPRETASGAEYFKKDNNCKVTPEEWSGIAGVIIEGLASSGEALKTHCSNQTEGVGFKESWRYEEEGETIVGLQMGHYDLIQKELYSGHMKGFNNMPVPWLIYTSLLGKGTDKKNGETVFGPQVVGNAATPQAPAWFMDCLHLDKQTYENKSGERVEGMVAWFERHEDSVGPYLCKARVMPESYPKLKEYFPHGFVPLGFKRGIVDYFLVLDKLRKDGTNNNNETVT